MLKRNAIVVGVWLVAAATVTGKVQAQQITKSASPTVQPPGNVGQIVKWTGASNSGIGILGDSILAESGGTILIQNSVAIGNNSGILQLLWNNSGVYEPFFRLRPTAGIGPSTIGGWTQNSVFTGVGGATVFGGGFFTGGNRPNVISNPFGTISGGLGNTAGDGTGPSSSIFGQTVGGGINNHATGLLSAVGGGGGNQSIGAYSVVPGGEANQALGSFAVVPGGSFNIAAGDFSLAAGRSARANHQGAFVWADTFPAIFTTSNANEFSARATGGFRFATQVDSSGNPTAGIFATSLGNVGINVTSPTSTLSVAGTISASGSITTRASFIFQDGSSQTTATFVSPGAGLQAAGGPGNETLSIPAGGIVNSMLGSGAVGAANIQAGAVGTTQLGSGAVGTAQLADGSVTNSKIASGAVGPTQIASNGVVSSNISPGAVGNTQLQSNAVTGPNIAAGQVVKSISSGSTTFTDAVTLQAGSNITITPSGNTLTIAASGGGSGSAPTINPMQIALLRWYDANQTGVAFGVGSAPYGAAFDGANIWITNYGDNTVTKLRANDGAILGTFGAGTTPFGVAFDGANIWVSNETANAVTKLRASDGFNLGSFSVGKSPEQLAFDGTNIWVANAVDYTATKLRASDGTNQGTFAVGNTPFGVAFDGANIWVGNLNDNSVTKLRASDGFNLGTFAVGYAPRGVAFDGSHMWVADPAYIGGPVARCSVPKFRDTGNTDLVTFNLCLLNSHRDPAVPILCVATASDGTVTKLRASDGSNIGTFDVGGNPLGVAFDGANIWVVVGGSNIVRKL